jgi:hypothetical protein
MPASTPARVQECAHIYPDGRTCRRIPKRGEKLCLGHQAHRQRRPGEEDEAFERQMTGWADQLDSMPLEKLLCAAQESLIGIAELIDRKTSRAHRIAFTRAGIAVTFATNKLEETVAGYRAQAITRSESHLPMNPEAALSLHRMPSQRNPGASPAPRTGPLPGAASTAEEKLQTLERIEALYGKLLTTLPSNT